MDVYKTLSCTEKATWPLGGRCVGRLVLLFLVAGVGCGTAPDPPTPSGSDDLAGTNPPTAQVEADAPFVTDVPRLLGSEQLREGWISLFDGQTLYGWQATTNANWRVEAGAIVVDSGPKGFLCTTTEFSDYALRLDFRNDASTNSGVFLRTQREPGNVATDCYELNIAPPSNPFPTGSLVQRARVAPAVNAGTWHTYEITVSGNQVQVSLDGAQVLDYEDPTALTRGRISLQFNEGRIAFRSICLRPLGLTPVFNGHDLQGWKKGPQMAGEFSVDETGVLSVRGGRGQLETERTYGDFVLQLECKVNAANLNSGIFFRCIPGDEMMGYESQIHNGFVGGNRAKPQDHGTGGIFHRQEARLVVADDLVWFHKTLIADGPHVAAWVNGLQVSDWVDTREPDPNPRRGRRLEAGTIMIQAHDPATDFSFRNLRIAQMAPASPAVSRRR